jgi:hypothetical protein
MESERKIALRDKVVAKACKWLACRDMKNGLTGEAKESAKKWQRLAEHELAGAAEDYTKEK